MTAIEKWLVGFSIVAIITGLFVLVEEVQKPKIIVITKIITIEVPAKKTTVTNNPPAPKPKLIPKDFETKTMLEIAAMPEYDLSTEEIKLLFTIRRVENGGPGLEFGVGDGRPNHPARRYAGDFEKSFKCQAMWAAGTIRKRFDGNLKHFAARYCYDNRQEWHRMAVNIMNDVKVPVSYDTCFAKL